MANVPGTALVLSQPIYDSIILPAGAAGAVVGTFFAVPQGGLIAAGVVKTRRHTNLTQAGRLEIGNTLKIKAMSIYFPLTSEAGAAPTIADIDAVRVGSYRLMLGGQTTFNEGPVSDIPVGGAAPVLLADVAGTAASVYQSGVSVWQNRYYFEYPIMLEAQETVSVIIDNMDLIAAATEVQLHLWGEMSRPVR